MTSTPQPRAFWLTVILPFGAGYFVTLMYRTVNAVLAHPIATELQLNTADLGFMTSTFVLAFAAVQIPLGMMLDSWGPRKTQCLMFLIGAAGIVVFSLSSSVWLLATGRAIIGIGMAGGLMAAFKAIADRVDRDDIPFYNGIILGCGGLGAIAATTPAKLIEVAIGWRELCLIMGGVTVAAALLIFLVNREPPDARRARPNLSAQIDGLREILKDRAFWRIVPIFATANGGFIAMQGLWLGPWLQHVEGFTPLRSANYLLLVAAAMTVGLVCGGLFARAAQTLRISLAALAGLCIGLQILTEIAIVAGFHSTSIGLWLAYGFLSTAVVLYYAVVLRHFSSDLSGRVVTTLNISAFGFAFLVQYLFGVILHLWPGGTAHPISGYRAAFGCLIAVEILALLAFVLLGRRGQDPPRS